MMTAAPQTPALSEAIDGSDMFDRGRRMRIAVVHDWLYTFGGAERVLRSILRCLPTADVFTLFDTLSEDDRARIGFGQAHTSFLQGLPAISRRHRFYLPLMPLAIEQFDLSSYDLIVSSSYAVAKGVLTGPDQLHLAYVHSPMRYAWDMQHQYLVEAGLSRGVKSFLARLLMHRMRLWDTRTAHGVNAYMANSHFVGRRVQKVYGRTAKVIYPPVEVPAAAPHRRPKQDFFLTASRLVPYKNVRAIADAFSELPDQRLVIVGAGPESERIKASAGPNVTLAGFLPDAELRNMMRSARAFVFAAEEDFGIVSLEAQSEGTPVVALGRGGSRETIVTDGPDPTGLFFNVPTPAAIAAALRKFLVREFEFRPAACHANALRFTEARFESEFRTFVSKQLASFHARLMTGCDATIRPREAELALAE
jgi:glycosyltransferase involved in cell wall biosynthesis